MSRADEKRASEMALVELARLCGSCRAVLLIETKDGTGLRGLCVNGAGDQFKSQDIVMHGQRLTADSGGLMLHRLDIPSGEEDEADADEAPIPQGDWPDDMAGDVGTYELLGERGRHIISDHLMLEDDIRISTTGIPYYVGPVTIEDELFPGGVILPVGVQPHTTDELLYWATRKNAR